MLLLPTTHSPFTPPFSFLPSSLPPSLPPYSLSLILVPNQVKRTDHACRRLLSNTMPALTLNLNLTCIKRPGKCMVRSFYLTPCPSFHFLSKHSECPLPRPPYVSSGRFPFAIQLSHCGLCRWGQPCNNDMGRPSDFVQFVHVLYVLYVGVS